MAVIAIVTDTDSSLPAALAAQYQIRQVPIVVQFGEEAFKTGEELDDARLFARINREKKLPTTAAPSPGQFVEVFQSALAAGADTVICYCVSSAVSATYQSALTARDLLPGRDIEVVDTRTLSLAQAFMALSAAEAARAGATKAEVLAHAQDVGRRTHFYAALPTLKYLAMGGRVSYMTAGLANVLNIQPVLTMREGKLDMLERVRTRTKAWARVIELTVAAAGPKPVERAALVQVNALADARLFEEKLRASLPQLPATFVADLTPGLSVHSGEGLIGVILVSGV
jgi:DegV family protein with EDD domain